MNKIRHPDFFFGFLLEPSIEIWPKKKKLFVKKFKKIIEFVTKNFKFWQ
jgi:hypothetical protein